MTKDASKTKTKTLVAKSPRTKRGNAPADYVDVLADMKRLIADSRHRALATVNRELVCLYWHIGRIIVQQQEHAKWGDAVVEQLAQDLRLAFPDMKGLSRDNVFRMRQFFVSCRDLDRWFATAFASDQKVGPAPRRIPKGGDRPQTATASPRNATYSDGDEKVGALTRQSPSMLAQDLNANIAELVTRLSWTHHYVLIGAVSDPAERYFYLQMSARERWSVRELRRQIDSGLYLRYMSVRRDPEKCLSDDAEQGDLLPFKDHYILEFLGLSDEYSERELRQAILANLRDFFLEFGRDLTFVGEEFAITVGNDTFYIDLLFFQQTHSPLPGVPGRGEVSPSPPAPLPGVPGSAEDASGDGGVWAGVAEGCPGSVVVCPASGQATCRARRNPRVQLRANEGRQKRYDVRHSHASLAQPPPRYTRPEPSDGPVGSFSGDFE